MQQAVAHTAGTSLLQHLRAIVLACPSLTGLCKNSHRQRVGEEQGSRGVLS